MGVVTSGSCVNSASFEIDFRDDVRPHDSESIFQCCPYHRSTRLEQKIAAHWIGNLIYFIQYIVKSRAWQLYQLVIWLLKMRPLGGVDNNHNGRAADGFWHTDNALGLQWRDIQSSLLRGLWWSRGYVEDVVNHSEGNFAFRLTAIDCFWFLVSGFCNIIC